MEMSKTVEEYLQKHEEYHVELHKLREIILSTELTETVKWGIPTYTINNKNVVGIGAFKSYCGLWFFNGSFLKDEYRLLINAQDGKTRSQRQMRFDSIDQIDEKIIREYLLEAIQNQKDGKEIKPEKKPLIIPDEMKEVLSSDAELSEAFESLTPGCKKEYAEYISDAKKTVTRLRRLDKIIPMIKVKQGLNDKYKA